MTDFTTRGKGIYKNVLDLEQKIFFDKNAGKKLDNIELRLKILRNDFDRQVKNLIKTIPSNKRSSQNIVNKSNKVKKVKVAEMNSAIDKLKKLSSGESVVTDSSSTNAQITALLANTGSKITQLQEVVGR